MIADWSRQRVLVVAPHPDDDILGCGGLISRVKREGGEVHVYVTVGDLADYAPAGASTVDQKLRETETAATLLGLDSWHIALPDDGFNLRLDTIARSRLVDLLERPQHRLALPNSAPSVVLTPDVTSYNQDHQAVAQAVMTALRPGPDTFRHQPALVLGYEEVGDNWSQLPIATRDVFVELNATDVDRKITALAAHASQWREHPHTRSEQALRGLAALRGAQSGFAHAEAFRCLRWRT